jgi:hypothetical protein
LRVRPADEHERDGEDDKCSRSQRPPIVLGANLVAGPT